MRRNFGLVSIQSVQLVHHVPLMATVVLLGLINQAQLIVVLAGASCTVEYNIFSYILILYVMTHLCINYSHFKSKRNNHNLLKHLTKVDDTNEPQLTWKGNCNKREVQYGKSISCQECAKHKKTNHPAVS